MLNKFTRWITILGLTSISIITIANSHKLMAQTPPVSLDIITPVSVVGLSELMTEAYNQNTGTVFEQSTIDGQLNFLFGWRTFLQGSYSENNINRDSELMNVIQKDYFKQLTQNEPNIRTRDIPNPFESSIQQNPSYIRK